MRYKDRQEAPADFKDTKLSKSDTGSAEATQTGVSNTHAYGQLAGNSYGQIGEGVAKGIKHASDFKEGYDLAKIDQKVRGSRLLIQSILLLLIPLKL